MLKKLLIPWWIILTVLGSILMRDMLLYFGDMANSAILIPGTHALIALGFMFTAHSYRSIKNEYKIKANDYALLAQNSIMELNNVLAEQKRSTADQSRRPN